MEGKVTKGGEGWGWVKVKILDNLLSIITLYIFKCINIAIKQFYKMCLSVLGVYILHVPLDLAKYRKYTRLRDCEGVYIIRRKTVFRQ